MEHARLGKQLLQQQEQLAPGVTHMADKRGDRAFDSIDETLAHTVAPACAVASCNATLIRKLRIRNVELERMRSQRYPSA